ncbi:MAG TPA: hypothetical protein VEJ63_21065, partial [Planctomycetota bacterium]|nr:hypothetical protein [Planctomycetota bacterium]
LGVNLVRAEDAPKPEVKAPEAKADDKKKGAPARIYPRGPEVEKLKEELKLSDAQIEQARALVAQVTKKNEELLANKDVSAAEEEVKKAKEALKAAEDKAKAAKDNFDLNEEYKKAVLSVVPYDKKEQAYAVLKLDKPKAPKKEEKKEEKKGEAKAVPAVAPPAPPAEQK